ncbi:thiamine-phosphate kinase [Rhodoplanes roseus]|uniref:Thiamine-monophosphate kinase n=1 Tax=Rhodoplanes roseus TaxID=29409 RepID=A0A327L448_9BRAD|nr:thiamine-phosphate kinase [Rhodoplanes roseus]RAI44603.1 thiamine-phosphate kinase [Rhodoplanes roseus]
MSIDRETTGSGEDRLIARHFAPLATHPGALGLTDDVALLTPPDGCELVLETDAIVAGMHFFADDPPASIARKALRINLSDLAAKGTRPLGFLLSLALPRRSGDVTVDDPWLAAFAAALGADAKAYGCPLLGGDTVASPGPVMISVTVIGAVPTGTLVKRRGARPGDRLVVTGTIGDAALGLLMRLERAGAGDFDLAEAERAHLLSRYLEPCPRNALAEAVRTHATAGMDVSDGLVGDLAKLCAVSGVTAIVETARLPLSEAARRVLAAAPELLATVLAGGDDYEILCTVAPERLASFLAAAAQAGVPATEIGEILVGQGAPRVLGPDGHPVALDRASFSHF